jgi:hypothetical protein
MNPWSSAESRGAPFPAQALRWCGAGRNISSKLSMSRNQFPRRKAPPRQIKVGEDLEGRHYNTAISALMILLKQMASPDSVSRSTAIDFVKLLARWRRFLRRALGATGRGGACGLCAGRLTTSASLWLRPSRWPCGKWQTRAEFECLRKVRGRRDCRGPQNEKVKPHLEANYPQEILSMAA